MSIKTAGVTCLFLLSCCCAATAQNKSKERAAYRASPPKAILVELFTHQKKIDYFTRTKEKKKMLHMKKDADSIIHKTVADFNTNFSFCPVFYFYDTNAALIRERRFDGVLLDNNLAAVHNNPIKNGDTNYFIVYYGVAALPPNAPSENVLTNSFKSNILDYTFTPLPTYTLYDKHNLLAKKTKDYRYVSKKFNISYKDQAAYLNRKFNNFYTAE